MLSFRKKNKSSEIIKPLVFVNRPICSPCEDIVGFSSQVNTICEAVKNGSTMIGVVADYGTGKSSITELLTGTIKKKPYKYPVPIKINLWDCLQNKKKQDQTDRTIEREVSELTKSFLYQLASGKDKKHQFSSYINKRLSRNYGNISFSTGSFKFWWKFMLAAISYTIYAVCSNSNVKFGRIIESEFLLDTLRFCHTFNPVFLVISILFLIWGIVNTCIVFSHWKTQTIRETEINDVFEVYAYIIDHIRPKGKNKKQFIIIEDLDRIAEKSIIIGFLKELYRFQNSMQNNSDRFAFIISIKPEAILKEDNVELVIDDKNTYSKIFDIIIPLKPIHYDDYDSILLKLISSDSSKKEQFEEITGETIQGDILPESFYWIKKGHNLTLRDLKDRLNHAIMIMISRKNYKVRSSVNFKACAAVTYLESEYPEQYYKLIQNEEAFAKIMSHSVEIINSNDSNKAIELLIEDFNNQFSRVEEFSNDIGKRFINDLCNLIYEGTFNYDFRMYFYTYPSGSHIKTTEERQLCDMLLMPSKFNDYSNIDSVTATVYSEGEDNIITKTIKSLEKYPEVILMNETLLQISCKLDWNKVAVSINSNIIEPMVLGNFAIDFWKRVHNIDFGDKPAFVKKLIDYLVESFSNPDDTALSRGYIVKAYGKDITEFREIFFNSNNQYIPEITEEEINNINDVDVSIGLIDINNLSEDNYIYISSLLCCEKLLGQTFEKAIDVLRKYADMKPDGIEKTILSFMRLNQYADNDMFHFVCKKSIKESIIEYLKILDPHLISDEYLDDIENVGFEYGLSEVMLKRLSDTKKFKSVLLTASKTKDFSLIDNLVDHSDEIMETCEWIQENYPDSFFEIRWHLCVVKKDNRYYGLYLNSFPLITEDEYLSLESTSIAIKCINTNNINEENYSDVLRLLDKRVYDNNEIVLLIKQLFDPDYFSDNISSQDELFKNVIGDFNFSIIDMRNLTTDDREIVYSIIKPGFELLGTTLDEQLHRLNCLIPSVEKELSDSDSDCYTKLVQELDELTPYTLEWMSRNYIFIPLSDKLSQALRENGDFENYITSSVLRENNMIIDTSIPVDKYLNVYIYVPQMYNIMSNHWDFLESLQKEESLQKLLESTSANNLISPLYKVPQHNTFFRFMLSDNFNDAEKILYLDSIGKFATDKDSKEFQLLICENQNMALMGDKERYWRVWNNFWNKSHKSQFTRKWKERWGNEIEL